MDPRRDRFEVDNILNQSGSVVTPTITSTPPFQITRFFSLNSFFLQLRHDDCWGIWIGPIVLLLFFICTSTTLRFTLYDHTLHAHNFSISPEDFRPLKFDSKQAVKHPLTPQLTFYLEFESAIDQCFGINKNYANYCSNNPRCKTFLGFIWKVD